MPPETFGIWVQPNTAGTFSSDSFQPIQAIKTIFPGGSEKLIGRHGGIADPNNPMLGRPIPEKVIDLCPFMGIGITIEPAVWNIMKMPGLEAFETLHL